MTKYNMPDDFISQILQLQARIERLENRSPLDLGLIQPIIATTFDTGFTVNSASFTDVCYFSGIWTSPCPVVRFLAFNSDSTTGGEFQLTTFSGVALSDIDGLPVTPDPILVGLTGQQSLENAQVPGYAYPFLSYGDNYVLKLQVRRTAGAGTILIKPKYLIQKPVQE